MQKSLVLIAIIGISLVLFGCVAQPVYNSTNKSINASVNASVNKTGQELPNQTLTNASGNGAEPATVDLLQAMLNKTTFPLPGYGSKFINNSYYENGTDGKQHYRQSYSVIFTRGSTGGGYPAYFVDVVELGGRNATEALKAIDWTGSDLKRELPRSSLPSMGDGVRAGVFDNNGLGTLELAMVTGNLMVSSFVVGSASKTADEGALGDAISLVDAQMNNIEKTYPEQFIKRATGEPLFEFNPPDKLPDATAGEHYEFSFCQPQPSTNTTACGPFPETTDPTGGQPPYHFTVQNGFPPFGIHCGKDGICSGVPHNATAGRTSTFDICAVDLSENYVCRTVSLTVGEAKPTGPEVSVSVTSATCTTRSSDGYTVVNLRGTVSGTSNDTRLLIKESILPSYLKANCGSWREEIHAWDYNCERDSGSEIMEWTYMAYPDFGLGRKFSAVVKVYVPDTGVEKSVTVDIPC
jgi:hypothetical protein